MAGETVRGNMYATGQVFHFGGIAAKAVRPLYGSLSIGRAASYPGAPLESSPWNGQLADGGLPSIIRLRTLIIRGETRCTYNLQ